MLEVNCLEVKFEGSGPIIKPGRAEMGSHGIKTLFEVTRAGYPFSECCDFIGFPSSPPPPPMGWAKQVATSCLALDEGL